MTSLLKPRSRRAPAFQSGSFAVSERTPRIISSSVFPVRTAESDASMPPGLKNMIERESSVAAYVATLKLTPGKSPNPRFHVGEPICLIGGDKIVVTTQWRYDSCFQDFWKLADILGYDMIEV